LVVWSFVVADSPRAVILGCAGTKLSARELVFFREINPFGFILFQRNCNTPDQVKFLVAEMRAAVGRNDAPVLIDQEGGRVARLKPPHWRLPPAAIEFSNLADRDIDRACKASKLNARMIAFELLELGIDVNCAPVLDLPQADADPIIGDRISGETPEKAAILGRAACEGYFAGGVLPVIKHVPGHGRATVDSHKALPLVDATYEDLQKFDFKPFKSLADMPCAMTAHVVFQAIDGDNPATSSARVINDVIRGDIGFDGVLLSDDLSMQALSGSFQERAENALEAGCDVVLHCNGKMEEMEAVIAGCKPLTTVALARIKRASQFKESPDSFDLLDAQQQLNQLLVEL
jgi:beta-N-acetylhexosaminidase